MFLNNNNLYKIKQFTCIFIINNLFDFYIAGWSSPVARQAHNLKVVGSNPTPATNKFDKHLNYLTDSQQIMIIINKY